MGLMERTVLLTTDKQYATLYGQITLTCSVNMDGANDVNFKRGSSKLFQLGSCDIFECQTVNTTKYKILKNTQTKKFDLVNLTINDFRETDSDNYHCEVVNNGDSGSIFLTYTVELSSLALEPSTDPISVIENLNQQFMCVTSFSRPEAVVKWYLDDEQLTSGIVTVTSQDSTTIPPVVHPLKNVVALERGNITVACEITTGIPSKTDFKWERMSDMTPVSMEQTLVIANIARTQSGHYRCSASNVMEPTGSAATVGNSTNTVYIDVQYEAKTASNSNDLEITITKSVCEDEGTCSSCIVNGPKNPERHKRYRSACHGLQTKLFFTSVEKEYFGLYRVHVNNELGNYTETFRLQSQDVYSDQDSNGVDNPGNNAAVEYEVVSSTKETSVYDALSVENDRPENPHVYMPLEESNPKSHAYYGNVKRGDPVYKSTVQKDSVQTVL
ncbi:hypothetical protein MAR_004505 [Mya arenaria]|uniref:Ig-like domain-containing protein n=1 Tax=Mya arenaria TaxID=6604 RepID=A0ABY7EX11_MYAAR|nr:hypothetical protein MAR_004505 [Mya arenaria]